MTHFRLANAIIVTVFALQCAVFLWLTFSPVLALVELLVGIFVASAYLPALFQRVVTGEGSITLSGFFIGGRKATAEASDLVSIRFHRFFYEPRGGWPSIAVFEFHAQTSPNYYLIPRFGWSDNRELFRVMAGLAAESPIALNQHTQRVLDAAAKA